MNKIKTLGAAVLAALSVALAVALSVSGPAAPASAAQPASGSVVAMLRTSVITQATTGLIVFAEDYKAADIQYVISMADTNTTTIRLHATNYGTLSTPTNGVTLTGILTPVASGSGMWSGNTAGRYMWITASPVTTGIPVTISVYAVLKDN